MVLSRHQGNGHVAVRWAGDHGRMANVYTVPRRAPACDARDAGPSPARGLGAFVASPAHRRTLLTYAAVGAASNIAYVVLFDVLQVAVVPVAANVVALLVTTLANTAAHRRYTFGIRGRSRLLIAYLGGFAGLILSFALSTIALTALDALDHQPSTLLASTTLWVATGLAAWVRFGPLRRHIGVSAMAPDGRPGR